MSLKPQKFWILFLLLFLLLFLTFNRHSRSGIQNYHSEIWGDKAGYYIYLPSFFIYDFQAEKLPDSIAEKTGNGFSLDSGIIKTKYSYGVALMQSPFFISAHLLAKSFGYENDGFSLIYHKFINVSAVVYAFLALIILYLFLIRYVSKRTALLTIACLFLGTNLFYYSIFETGMSHVYSFFLFACYLYLSPYVVRPKPKLFHYLLFGFVVGLIVAVRPLNVMFLPVFFLFNKITVSDILNKYRYWLLVVIYSSLVILPQLIYWKYSSGRFFNYSYGDEGFSNIFSPKMFELWFSTRNGLFVFNPLVALILTGLLFFYKVAPKKAIVIGIYFLFISFVFSSWHDWGYGCSYGSRPFVEYYSILTLPFAFFISRVEKNTYKKPLLLIILIVFILYNLKMMFTYDGCWYGGEWDWTEWLKMLLGPTK